MAQILEASEKVYTAGCVEVVLRMAEDNLYVVGGIVIGLAVPQVLSLVLPRFIVLFFTKAALLVKLSEFCVFAHVICVHQTFSFKTIHF